MELVTLVSLMMLLALGAVQFGVLFSIKMKVEHAAREGARYAAAEMWQKTDRDIVEVIRDYTINVPGLGDGLVLSPNEVTVDFPDSANNRPDVDKPVRVVIKHPVPLTLLPFRGAEIVVTGSEMMRIQE